MRWRDVEEVAPAVVTGMTEDEAAAALRTDRPVIVYVYRDVEGDEDPRLDIEQDRAFTTSEKTAVGARFFDCLRIELEDAKTDRALKAHVKNAPCLVFVRPNYEVAAVMRGKLKANRVFSAMCKTLQKDYKNCVKSALKAQKGLAKARADVDRNRLRLLKLDEQIDKVMGSKRARLQKARDALSDQVADAENKLLEREAALYRLKPRKTEKEAAS